MDSAGGIGSIGGLTMTPKVLTKEILGQGMLQWDLRTCGIILLLLLKVPRASDN